jgi:hypothetical protein
MMTMMMMLKTFGLLLRERQEQADLPLLMVIFGFTMITMIVANMIMVMITRRRESLETNQSRATALECIQVLQTLYQLRRDLHEEHVKLNEATKMQGVQPHTSVEKSLLFVIVQIANEESRARRA